MISRANGGTCLGPVLRDQSVQIALPEGRVGSDPQPFGDIVIERASHRRTPKRLMSNSAARAIFKVQIQFSRICSENGSARQRDVVSDLLLAQLSSLDEALLFESLIVDMVSAMPDDLHAAEQGDLVQ